eukprot:1194340-Prorocentrum_minimum.AAC.5
MSEVSPRGEMETRTHRTAAAHTTRGRGGPRGALPHHNRSLPTTIGSARLTGTHLEGEGLIPDGVAVLLDPPRLVRHLAQPKHLRSQGTRKTRVSTAVRCATSASEVITAYGSEVIMPF